MVSLVTAFVAFFAGQAVLSGKGVAASLFHAVTVPANAITTCVGAAGGAGPRTATARAAAASW